MSHRGDQSNILNQCPRKPMGAISSILLGSSSRIHFLIYVYNICVRIYIFNEGKFKVEIHWEIRVCLSLESAYIIMDFSSNLRKKASNLKMPLAVNYSFLSCPGYAMLKAGDFPCSPECSSILWVTGTHSYLMKFWGIFSALQDMGKISFYGTKCSKPLPWDKDLNLTDSSKDWGLWLNGGDDLGWTSW